MKLNLGCGNDKKAGFVNVDIQAELQADLIANVQYLDEIQDCSVSEIYASHILEHFPHWQTVPILQAWHQKLITGGKITIRVPDLKGICSDFVNAEKINDLKMLVRHIYGGQDHSFNYHCTGFTHNLLTLYLQHCSFKKISIISTKENNHQELVANAEK